MNPWPKPHDIRRPCVTPPARRGRQPFLWLLCFLLLIYAALGRTGAHIGIPLGGGSGIYIGDLVLLFGLAMLMLQGSYKRFFALPVAWLWFLFFTWNAAQTLPYFSQYGLVTVRDGAVWGYSLFVVIVASNLLARPSGFVMLLNWYGRFARLYVYFVLIVAPVSIYYYSDDLTPPDAAGFDPPVVEVLLPHVAGSVAFVLCRFVSVPAWWWWAVAVEFFAIGTQGRGVLIAFIAAAIVVWLLNPWGMRPSVRAVGLLAGLGFMLAATVVLNLNLGVSRHRTIGPSQLFENIAGLVGNTEDEALDGTRKWRMEFWTKIIDYTVFGPYFWTGKGYGINLADDAGLQVSEENPTRSPENSHLTLLARSGVPGLLLWVVLQLTWAVGILRILFFARRTGRRRTTGLMTFILAYWTEFMVHAATGVVFEGPHGGVWFWTIFGVGAASAHMVRRDADFFERMEFRAAAPTSRRAVESARPFPRPHFTYN